MAAHAPFRCAWRGAAFGVEAAAKGCLALAPARRRGKKDSARTSRARISARPAIKPQNVRLWSDRSHGRIQRHRASGPRVAMGLRNSRLLITRQLGGRAQRSTRHKRPGVYIVGGLKTMSEGRSVFFTLALS